MGQGANKEPSPPPAISSPVHPLLYEARVTATIDTGYTGTNGGYLENVSCVSDEHIWTSGMFAKAIELRNLQSELVTSIQTENGPWGITVTRDGCLVYTDYFSSTINLVKNKKIRTVITLQGWKPLFVCCTAANDLLVTMISDDKKQFKVVRYSGSIETQTIQFDDQGHRLYYPDKFGEKYICENRNLDICVTDQSARAVVVVDQSGKLRFKYTGYPSETVSFFIPLGITTDSHSHILVSDRKSYLIHIVDQDGQFLRLIQNLFRPNGLCVDSRDNLFVAEFSSGKVKKIKYL